MGTNYYRIPTHEEMERKKEQLIKDVQELSLEPSFIKDSFGVIPDGYDKMSIWDKFTCDTLIHLGKRSGGWKFLWNFHDDGYYANKEELLTFIRTGRVVDEYGKLQDTEDFIEMALGWCQPDGLWVNEEYCKKQDYFRSHVDKEIDGLTVCSSSDFC